MRKYHQKLILELVQTLDEANEEIGQLLTAGKASTLFNLLADCQDIAIQIGNSIEELVGEGTKSVSCLEEYCQLLFEINTLAGSGDKPTGALAIHRKIRKQIAAIRSHILTECRPDKLEIVFMPYNVNMWDCLESIWLAAKNDPQCDVYVVPLPYCSRNADGRVEQIHCDASHFPDYVPVLHYDAYDLAVRKPDVIYIHNPYDQYNYVTSIHPRFYSAELKKHTDMLVYVPYFVSGEKFSADFFAVSAIMHVDKIIVQSEAVRKGYLEYARKDQVVALGSAKLDKVLSTKREEQQLPAEWKTIIGNRKVVLYNTHLRNLMAHDRGFSFIEKLKSVFAVFNNREDVVLWWRPHPLSEETVKSMNPAFLQAYSEVVAEYKRSHMGIYDDSGDLHRAIALSDAYYGDRSSIVYLYGATGKPVLFENVGLESVSHKDGYRLSFMDFAVSEHTIWFVPTCISGLFCLDLTTGHMEFITYNAKMKDNKHFSAMSVSVEGNYVVTIPGSDEEIIAYNRDSGYLDCNALKVLSDEKLDKAKFGESHQYNGCIYMIPRHYPAFVKYNPQNGEITINRKPCLDLDRYRQKNDELYCLRGKKITDTILMLPSLIGNIVLKYDMSSDEHILYRVGDITNQYAHIAFDGSAYWLFQPKGNIIRWQMETGETEELNQFPDGFEHTDNHDFVDVVVYKKDIFLFPHQSNMILKIDTSLNQVSCFLDLASRKSYGTRNVWEGKYACAKVVGDFIYAMSFYEKALQKINPVTGEITNIPLVLSQEEYSNVLKQILFRPPINQEQSPFYYEIENDILECFLDYLRDKEDTGQGASMGYIEKLFVNSDGSCGLKIHNYIKAIL